MKEPTRELVRWGVSAAVVVACYGAAIGAVMAWRPLAAPVAAPALALAMIELEPAPAPPPPPRPPEPPPPEIEKTPEPPPVVKAEVTVPPPKRKPPPPRPTPIETPPLPQPAPRSETPREPPPAPAPMVAMAPVATPNQMAAYLGSIVRHVQRNLRYPRDARTRHEQGMAYVRLTLNPAGRVVAYSMDRRSGFRTLDEEALAVIKRAEPFPPMPPDIAQDTRDFTLPVQFTLR